MYTNVNSNNPPSIVKQMPSSINRRLSTLSSDEVGFLNNILPYRDFPDELTYVEPKILEEDYNEKSKRKRKIIRFNPPYSKNVKTNIGNIFFKLLHKRFLPSHLFHKIFNKTSGNISYSCMRSMSSIISTEKCSTNVHKNKFRLLLSK